MRSSSYILSKLSCYHHHWQDKFTFDKVNVSKQDNTLLLCTYPCLLQGDFTYAIVRFDYLNNVPTCFKEQN